MTKIEIDNKKMWESILGFQLEGEEAKKFNDLCKIEPFKVTLAFFSKAFKKGLKDQGLCYKEGEITAIEPDVKWYVALNDYGHYDNTIIGAVPLFLKGERTTKENVFNMCKDIMGYEITEEEFNKNFRPATEEDTTRKTLVEVYRASVDSSTKEPEQPKDEIPQKTKFKVGDHIKRDGITPRKGVVTEVNNGWYTLDDRYVLDFEYEDNWELVESKPEPKKCLFTKDLYTDEERKELCEGCQEECELNKNIPMLKEVQRMEECPYRQVGCTMYEGKILECKGACSWVADYPKLKELKAQKGE